MKLIKFKYSKTDENASSGFLIENFNDLHEYRDFLLTKIDEGLSSWMKWVGSNKFDCNPREIVNSFECSHLQIQAVIRMIMIQNKNPIFTIHDEMNKLFDVLIDKIKIGNIVINEAGGWNFVDPALVISSDTYTYQEDFEVDNPHSPFIQLENDPVLDENYIEEFSKALEESSLDIKLTSPFIPATITNLKRIPPALLLNLLKNWNGFHFGKGEVYEYTTGLNTDQILDYLNIINQAGIKRVVFLFSAGYDGELKSFINKCKDLFNKKDFKIEVLNQE